MERKQGVLKGSSCIAAAGASIANLNVGFDCLGIALQGLEDRVRASFSENKGAPELRLVGIEQKQGQRILSLENNAVLLAGEAFLSEFKSRGLALERGIELFLWKGIPLCSGLGSSAASAVSCVYAMNELLGQPFSLEELLLFAIHSEHSLVGAFHGDNAAASLYGGLCFVHEKEEEKGLYEVHKLSLARPLWFFALHPCLELDTKESRLCLKKNLSMKEHLQDKNQLACTLLYLLQGKYRSLKKSMREKLVEPQRKALIPYFEDLKQRAYAHESLLAFGISGSGPSVFALCEDEAASHEIALSLESLWRDLGVDCRAYFGTTKQSQGAYIVDEQTRKELGCDL